MGCLAVLQPHLPLGGVAVAIELQINDADSWSVRQGGWLYEGCDVGRRVAQRAQVVAEFLACLIVR